MGNPEAPVAQGGRGVPAGRKGTGKAGSGGGGGGRGGGGGGAGGGGRSGRPIRSLEKAFGSHARAKPGAASLEGVAGVERVGRSSGSPLNRDLGKCSAQSELLPWPSRVLTPFCCSWAWVGPSSRAQGFWTMLSARSTSRASSWVAMPCPSSYWSTSTPSQMVLSRQPRSAPCCSTLGGHGPSPDSLEGSLFTGSTIAMPGPGPSSGGATVSGVKPWVLALPLPFR